MAQWQEVQNLANAYLEQVHQLYAGSALPMAVRQCLAAWIESQNWRQAAEPLSSHARMLFHSLLALLDEHLGSLGMGNEDFMLKHNLRKARRDLQAEFEECPDNLANLVANLLQEERQILRLGQAGGEGGAAPAPSTPPESNREQQIQRRLAEFHAALQEAERAFRHLEDMQDAFDFCFKLHYRPGEDRTNDPQYTQQIQALQAKLQILDRQRREVLAQMQQLLGRSETLRDFLQQELEAWQERQQRACLGAPVDTRLQPLETWFTELGQGLFQLLQLLRALGDLRQKVSYERDPLKAETPLLERRLLELLTYLLRRAFVVEQQPSMPNACKRPLVLRTTSKFSARARLLVRLHDRNHRMEAKIHIDRDPPKIKGFRKFNILTSSSKTLLAGDCPQEGLVCDFQYLTLKEQKDSRSGKGSKGVGEGPLVVTEELHLITFTLAYAYCGLQLELETSTLPFVIISNNNQLSSAWASILWFNMLSCDPKEQQFFSAPPPAPWPRLAEVLSWQFESVAERGLSKDHLLMLAEKLFGSKASPESTVAWPKFSKDGAAGFSFWAWLDGILGLLQEHLKQLWKAGLILGFVSRKQEKKLLKGKRTGTFLIRFSESVLGGVTCTWVEHPESGPPAFRAVVPYTTAELESLALPDIIRDYQLLVEENIPENPLQFLYPNIPRDEAFGPYYSQRQEANLMEQKKYLNRRLIRVSSRQANESWQTEEELVATTENLEMLQLQPSGLGTQEPGGLASLQHGSSGTLQPRGLGTLQVASGNVGTLQPSGPGTVQVVATSPEMLQVTSGNLGTLQPSSPGTVQVVATNLGMLQVTSGNLGMLQVVAGSPGTMQPGVSVMQQPGSQVLDPPQLLQVGSGVSELLQPGIRDLKPQLVLQVVPEGQGMLQVGPGAMEPQLVLQLVSEGQGLLQVGSENLGTMQPVAGDTGMLQVGPENLGTMQPVAGDTGMLQVGSENLGTMQPVAGDTGMLQVGPENLGMMQPVAGDTGMLQVGPENLGTMQPVAGDTGMLQVGPENLGTMQPVAGDTGVLQPVPGAVELLPVPEGQGTLLVPEEQGTLPPELRDLEPLPGSLDVQELLQSLENVLQPRSGTLETLEAAELMPDMLEARDGRLEGLDPGLAGSAALLNPRDPFLPQPEDTALPTVSSLFTTDFPPLHIDASDFQ
ncbi:signal transducer and activator of transcription 2 isoform X1 [Falco cherrug]|uniref:signal transducer and activator of transcription 2 isoform X1 n=1 Tax=Falco cherrug TaxID=345164 RepID=UPI00247A1F5C|nr:signal transducer and activator of transcription 2 isoform X1 [Falco cherrug]XP_055552572.1 signal transducer and activator of transcription 2 isoform X1 [Falco cherrug]